MVDLSPAVFFCQVFFFRGSLSFFFRAFGSSGVFGSSLWAFGRFSGCFRAFGSSGVFGSSLWAFGRFSGCFRAFGSSGVFWLFSGVPFGRSGCFRAFGRSLGRVRAFPLAFEAFPLACSSVLACSGVSSGKKKDLPQKKVKKNR